ncbi:MAG TPA: hypothetical protein ENK31_07080, partial [Nannocystis exedens]|nr:hypothetical protein [Nannocystis exedens]
MLMLEDVLVSVEVADAVPSVALAFVPVLVLVLGPVAIIVSAAVLENTWSSPQPSAAQVQRRRERRRAVDTGADHRGDGALSIIEFWLNPQRMIAGIIALGCALEEDIVEAHVARLSA